MQEKWLNGRWDEISVSVLRTDSTTEFSLDGENWSATLDNVASSYSNTTVYARNTSAPGCSFVWTGLTGEYSYVDENRTAVRLSSEPGMHYDLACDCLPAESINVWTGESGDFYDDSNWSLGRAPVSTDSVILPNSGTAGVTNVITVSGNPFSVRFIHLGGEGDGAVHLKCANGLSTNEVSGSVIVRARGMISHEKNPSSATTLQNAVYKLNMKTGGNLVVEKDGEISANAVGYAYGKWPSGGVGTYGGYGSGGAGYCYGSIREPTDLGAGGQNHATYGKSGGGAIYLDVTGELIVSGDILADSGGTGNKYHDGGGAGGSVFLKCATLRGTGVISARGNVQGNSCGGAGRIAIYQRTAVDWSGFTGTIPLNVVANKNLVSHPIYLQCANDSERGGTLYVRRDAATTENYKNVWLMPSYDGGINAYRNMAIVLDGGVLSLSDSAQPVGSRLPVRDIVANTSTSKIYCDGRVLSVSSRAHSNCKGWASTYETHVVEDGGKVRWAGSFVISIR